MDKAFLVARWNEIVERWERVDAEVRTRTRRTWLLNARCDCYRIGEYGAWNMREELPYSDDSRYFERQFRKFVRAIETLERRIAREKPCVRVVRDQFIEFPSLKVVGGPPSHV